MIRRGDEEVSLEGTVRENWNTILGIVLIGGVSTHLLISQGAGIYLNRELIPTLNDSLPAKYHLPLVSGVEDLFGLPREMALIAAAVVAVISILLRLDAGEVIQTLALTAIYSVLLWGMWKHKSGDLIEG